MTDREVHRLNPTRGDGVRLETMAATGVPCHADVLLELANGDGR